MSFFSLKTIYISKKHYVLYVKFKLNFHGLFRVRGSLEKTKLYTHYSHVFYLQHWCHLIRKAVNKIQEGLHFKVFYQGKKKKTPGEKKQDKISLGTVPRNPG
jgi:hypothetical protein